MQLRASLVGFVLIALISIVAAWGSDGHAIVGQVAQSFLTGTTLTAVNKQLGGNTLASISSWPDNYDHSTPGKWSSDLHYVDIGVSAVAFSYDDCKAPTANPPGCVVTAINNYTVILQNNLKKNYNALCVNSSTAEPCPLSFLTHFTGDVHQPMHVAYGVDQGGNKFQATYEGSCTQMHSIWDSRLLYTYMDDNDYEWPDVAQVRLLHG